MKIYELVSGLRTDGEILRWGASKYGNAEDIEMREKVWANHRPGGGTCCVVRFAPSETKHHTPAQMRAHRTRNLIRRIESDSPLFADQMVQEAMIRPKYQLEHCVADLEQKKRIEADFIGEFWRCHPRDREVTRGCDDPVGNAPSRESRRG